MTMAVDETVLRTLTPTLGDGNVEGTAWAPDSRAFFAVIEPAGNGQPSHILVFPVPKAGKYGALPP